MKSNIIKPEDLPEKESIFLKKDFLGWKIVHPIRNEDGSLNWLNMLVGGKRNLFNLSMFFVILVLVILGINELISQYAIVANAPCEFCSSCVSGLGGGSIDGFSSNVLSNHT